MWPLDDDATFSLLSHASGHTLSQAMMVCRWLCALIRGRDDLWGRLLRRRPTSVDLGHIPRTRPWFEAGENRYFYALAYASLKFAMRAARQEYTVNGVLMKDCILCMVGVLASFHDDSTLGERARFVRAWRETERVMVRYPIGTYFDATEAFADLEAPLSTVLTGMRQVAINPALSHPVCRLRLSHRRDAAERERLHGERVWELKRVVRRVGYLLKVGRRAMRTLG